MTATGFWSETKGKAKKRQRDRVQKWLADHPVTLASILGLKGLAWDLPAWGVRGLRGRTKTVKKADGSEAVVVTTEGDNPKTLNPKRNPVPNGRANEVLNRARQRVKRPAKVRVTPISKEERTAIVEKTQVVLTRTYLGKEFTVLAGTIREFQPVRGMEATTVTEFLRLLSRSTARISMGMEAFVDIVGDHRISPKVGTKLHDCAEKADVAAEYAATCHRRAADLYANQIAQEQSGTAPLASTPVPLGTGDAAEGVWPSCVKIAGHLAQFTPETDKEATQTLGNIRILQSGFGLLAETMDDLPKRLHHHGIVSDVTSVFGAYVAQIKETGEALESSAKHMATLYRGQLDHEASDTSTARTTPLTPVA